MKSIWKYPLVIDDEQKLMMPYGVECLCVQMQGTIPCLWALVDPKAPVTTFRILTRGTGHEIGSGITKDEYVGTYQTGPLVFHVFIT